MQRALALPLLATLAVGVLPLVGQTAMAQPGPGFDRDHRPPPPPRHYRRHHHYYRHVLPPR
ncbi:hypothetical protein [Lichenicoccus roseus]|uniref:Uncharacterized protein n=1 Tax=Lichenicoccus roseus TaxID=2683649 RepID=A0A5R9J6F9_9PROT|nr:hypothetical protein [Lichenicoccus roseus]TLU73152.1 hypothetical protein FE263_06920 [Lichenicoccus roseus]